MREASVGVLRLSVSHQLAAAARMDPSPGKGAHAFGLTRGLGLRHTPTLSLRPGPCMRLRPRAHLGPRAHARPKALVIQASTWGAACVRPARAARTDACMRLVHGGRERAARVLHREVLPYRLELLGLRGRAAQAKGTRRCFAAHTQRPRLCRSLLRLPAPRVFFYLGGRCSGRSV